MTHAIETIMVNAAVELRGRGLGDGRLRLPATTSMEFNEETGMFDIPLPSGAGSFPGEKRIELLKDGEVAVNVTENMVRLWGDDDKQLAQRLFDLAEIIG